jgi:dTDP-4-dehydrorhamnose reductase
MKVLLVGAYGQVGQELIRALKPLIGLENIVCADLRLPPESVKVIHHEHLNALDNPHLNYILGKHQITDVYCLAALLSASG